MPRFLIYGLIVFTTLALIPPALILRARTSRSEVPRIHIVQDMDNQHRRRTQTASALFADGRASRPFPPATVPLGGLRDDEHFHGGLVDGEWAEMFPEQTPVTRRFVERGRDRFNIYCAPCHGYSGHGDGLVALRADRLTLAGVDGTAWTPPRNIHEPAVREQPPGQIYNTITHGIRNMAGYAAQIPVEDRWAIVAYVKALQYAQNAAVDDLPPDVDAEELDVIELPPAPPADEEAGAAEAGDAADTGAAAPEGGDATEGPAEAEMDAPDAQ